MAVKMAVHVVGKMAVHMTGKMAVHMTGKMACGYWWCWSLGEMKGYVHGLSSDQPSQVGTIYHSGTLQ